MDFGADIVVTSPGEAKVHLVVEVKLREHADAATIHQLKHYMFRTGAPSGLLVTRSTVTVLRDTFHARSEGSIQVVKTIATSSIPELQPFAAGLGTDPAAFEDAVQDWLVQLRCRLVEGYARGVDPVLAEHVMPALAAGEIRAGGPRRLTRAAS